MAVSEEEKQVLMRVDVILWMVKSSKPIGQEGTQTHRIQLLKSGNFLHVMVFTWQHTLGFISHYLFF